jgi:arginase
MKIQLLSVPYDSGVRNVRMGAGPALLKGVLRNHLVAAGHHVELQEVVAPESAVPAEIATAFAINTALADEVRDAAATGRLPVVLSGSCYAALGIVAGLAPRRPGVVWFDSHADLNTPDTTLSGFLDGMALAMLTGRCWEQLTSGIGGFRAVPSEAVLLVGARAFDDLEYAELKRSAIQLIAPAQIRSELPEALGPLRDRVQDVYLHIDLDVLDPAHVRANALAAPGGLSRHELTAAMRCICRTVPVRALSLTAYDPGFDPAGEIGRTCCDILDAVLSCGANEG